MLRCRLTALTLLNARLHSILTKKGSQPKTDDLMDQSGILKSTSTTFQNDQQVKHVQPRYSVNPLTLSHPGSRPELLVSFENGSPECGCVLYGKSAVLQAV